MTRSANRRDTLKTMLTGSVGAVGAASASSVFAKSTPELDLSDPIKEFQTRIKIIGSLANEPVYTFMRLNVYADPHNGNFVPMFTMNNLLVDRWEKVADDHFIMTKFEAGYFTEFDGDKRIDSYDNPFTGETVDIFDFKLGPVRREYMPDEVIAMAYAPEFLPIETIGGRVFVATQSIESSGNLFTQDEFPIEYPGSETSYLNSFMTWSADYENVANPDVMNAPAHVQIQNKLPWGAWMRMRGRQGGTSLRGFGAKLKSLDDLPPGIREGFSQYVPDILKTEQWEQPHFEAFDYLKVLQKKKEEGTYWD